MAAPMKTWRFLSSLRKVGISQVQAQVRCFSVSRRLMSDAPGKWQLISAVCLERPAVVTSEKNALEKEYGQMLEAVEFERSRLSDHELRHKEDLLIAERRKSDDYEDLEADASRTTALEVEDSWDAEASTFTPAPRTTAADESGDKTTHARQLDRKLTLLVQQSLGNRTHWLLPQGPRQEEETMRQAAERVLEEKCGSEIQAQFLGNAPAGVYKYKFSTPKEDNIIGAKVFFFKALLKNGKANPSSNDIEEVAWVTKEELGDMVSGKYRQRINQFILDL